MPNQNKWDNLFANIAVNVSRMSKDPSTQVGAVIVGADNRKMSFGYNGFVAGIEEDATKWERPLKYQYVQHAELNAIINCPFDTVGCTLYCTHQPCHRCLEMVAQSGIRRIVFIHKYANLEHQHIWDEHAKLFDEVIQLSFVPDAPGVFHPVRRGVAWLLAYVRGAWRRLWGGPSQA
jgi:dCMP deaminase